MPMNRSRYPKDWDSIARAIKVEANWICQDCGKQCLKPETDTSQLSRSERGKLTLTVHHLDCQPDNNEKENLIALCAPCHLRIHRCM
jgi:5-methylcytosine-specific restriction endonuclease McrA